VINRNARLTPLVLTPLVLTPLMLAVLLVVATSAPTAAQPFPEVIRLPNGFQPEGIASGRGSAYYVGSLADGAIYKGDLRTGAGAVLVPGQPGRVVVGLRFNQPTGALFVAGGPTGSAFVYDTRTGQEIGVFALGGAGSFLNDVALTRTAAYFTDSAHPQLYRLPLDPNGTPAPPAQTLPLGGEWTQAPGFNANGIVATPNGDTLIVVNSTLGALYRVDPATGQATRIDLAGQTVERGDGLLLDGRTLFVVRNVQNRIAVVQLDPGFASGQVTGAITSPHFRVPTTIAEFGSHLYAVNARFGVAPEPTTEYEVVRVPKR
jgi:sugar lactone lactonase YvrE